MITTSLSLPLRTALRVRFSTPVVSTSPHRPRHGAVHRPRCRVSIRIRRADGLRFLRTLLVAGVCTACVRNHPRPLSGGTAPLLLRGEFIDDYRGRFSISDSIWFQRPANRFRIVSWHADEQYLIARNADDDPTAPGLWTRIDWVTFDGMKPFSWGFCLTAYRATSRIAAINTTPADRTTPRSGCNGYPFTRMQRADSGGISHDRR